MHALGRPRNNSARIVKCPGQEGTGIFEPKREEITG